MADPDVVSQINKKIQREEALINAAVNMRASSSNTQVQSSLDAQIKEGRRNIGYLEGRLKDLEERMGGMSLSGDGGSMSPTRGGPSSWQNNPGLRTSGSSSYGGGPIAYGQVGYGGPPQGDYQDQLGAGSGMMPPRAPFGPSAPGSGMPKARPNYSKLDLIKADTQHLGPRFQMMLSQLTFKLSVEKQYLNGIEKLARLYQLDNDRRSRAEAEGRRIESNEKIRLLSTALRRYEDLHVDMEMADAHDDDSINTAQGRRPLTGRLTMKIHAVKDVNHILTGRFTSRPETWVVIKVEDVERVRTKPTKTDRWTDEQYSVDVDKANEIEVTVYDKSGAYPTPIGMLWIRISDIVEEMRRKKIEVELSGSQWVTAEQMDTSGGAGVSQHSTFNIQPQGSMGGPGSRNSQVNNPTPPGNEGADPNAIEAWFSLEPVGSIRITMSFIKQNRGKAAFDVGLNRKGAVRQRKEEVQEQYGHQFVVQQFYSIMRCALCGDFLKYAAGMQCEDCKYTCHQKCFSKVVTKCISKSNAETDPDEEKINHRIPHRFEPFSNLSANWCCHCGYMLPFGKKNSKKCSECSLTVHASCAHLVPDFCGMSMITANEILQKIKGIAKKPTPMLDHKRGALADGSLRSGKTSRPGAQTQQSYAPTSPSSQDPRISGVDRNSYSSEQSYGQPRISQTWAGDATPRPSGPQSPTRQERPQLPGRAPTDPTAAAAAAAALSGHRTSQGPPSHQAGAARPGTRQSGHGSLDTHQEIPPASPSGANRQSQQQQQQQQQHAPYDPSAYAGYGQPPAPLQQASLVQQSVPPRDYNNAAQMQVSAVAKQSQSQPLTPQEPTAQQQAQRRIGLEHFNFLAVLGKGNFGKVMLAETKATKKLYAIKVLKKEFIIENDEIESTRSEKRVFQIANKERHPFLLNLHACFQTETRVYFVMEYISGGDLMMHIQRGQFGLKRTQFYAAEVCLALKYFHENGVVYRDLKLDNILLALDGHIKVGDYGLCKEDMWYGSSTGTFCGTPEFMAPEIVLSQKYNRSVDWWAFGVLIYQMLLQQSPFRGEDEEEIYDSVIADEPLYPIHMPRDSVSILQKLLTREPELRLGSGPTDAQEIMSHAFFRNTNWQDVRDKKVPPPYIPSIKNATDTSNFDSEFTSVTPVLTPVQSVLTQAMQEEFRGFSYSADFV